LNDYDEAVAGGAARYKAASLMGLNQRTLKRGVFQDSWHCFCV
jgi:putative transposase